MSVEDNKQLAVRFLLRGASVNAVATLMAVFDLGAVVFATNDEARFPLLARDILTRGDVWFPQLNGVVYQNKPLLLAWLIALVSWPIGQVTALTALVPSILAALALALVVYAAARDMFGPDAGRYAGLVVATSQGFVVHARQAMPDTLFVIEAQANGAQLSMSGGVVLQSHRIPCPQERLPGLAVDDEGAEWHRPGSLETKRREFD